MNTRKNIFLTQDILNKSIILEFEEIDGNTDRLSEKIKSLAHILVPAYTKSEVNFARTKPELVSSDFMLNSLASIISKNLDQVNWKDFE